MGSRHIIVAVDAGQASENALRWAIKHMHRPGDTFHVIHVVPENSESQLAVLNADLAMDVPMFEDDAHQRERVDAAKASLSARFQHNLQEAQVDQKLELVTTSSTDPPSIGYILCRRAEELQAAALVITKHPSNMIKELFVGSATNFCCHNCPCPVVVLHP